MRWLAIALLILLCVSAAFAAAPPGRVPPEVQKLIDQLGDDDEDTRKDASKKLEALGEDVVPALRLAVKQHADIDTRLRAGVIAAAIVSKLTDPVREYKGHTGWVYRMAVTPDGKKIVTCGDHIRVWDLDSGKELLKFQQNFWGWGVSVSRDSKRLLAGAADQTVRLYDLESGKVLQSFVKHTNQIWVAELSPDGKLAVTGGFDKALHVWDTETGKHVRSFEKVEDFPRCAAFSADGKQIAIGHFSGNFQNGEGVLRIWDVQTGKMVRAAKGHLAALTNVVYSPDGKSIASSSFDKTVRLWDAKTLTETKKFTVSDQGCDGVAFTPNGKRLVTAGWGNDRLVKVWDIATGKEIRRYDAHSGSVINVAVTPDGKHVVTSGVDSVIRRFRLPQ